MKSIAPAAEKTSASIEVDSKPHHASFSVGGELKRSLTLAKLLEHAGFSLKPGQRFRVAVELLCLLLCFTYDAAADDATKFPRGALRSPAHHLLAAPTHRVLQAPPAQFALVPAKLDMWGNDQFGDCVTAEEAFCKACFSPEIFVEPQEVTRWARRHGYLHGADLASVLQSMQRDGFQVGAQQYDDGAYASVDYSSETVLRSALATGGPVKIAIDANALPADAGHAQGWYSIDCGQKFPNTDHCVSLCGYGPAEFLYSQLKVPLPAALAGSTPGYLLFTWSTIGFVTHDWLMTTCAEAWVRTPSTVGNPPLVPTPAPPAPPSQNTSLTFSEVAQLAVAASDPNLSAAQSAAVAAFFSDDASPRVDLLRSLVYRRGLSAGVIPAGTPIGAVDWKQLIAILVELEPLIVPLIPVLFGDEQTALAAPAFTLCSAPAKPKKQSPKYRKECGPNGCKLVPVEPSPRVKLFKRR